MNKEEAINWLYEHSKAKPFLAWGQGPQTEGWHCWGCDGEFVSTWPKWEKPTFESFPHKRDCKYKKMLEVLSLKVKEQTE